MSLICVMKCDKGEIHAVVLMTPDKPQGVRFQVYAKDLPSGKKGFHVHQTGNILEGCQTLGPHYNPTNDNHGDLNQRNAHRGDLGNLTIEEDGACEQLIVSNLLTLDELLGRSLVIHSEQDDLGRGGNPESLKTGNSGSRICCGVIGYA